MANILYKSITVNAFNKTKQYFSQYLTTSNLRKNIMNKDLIVSAEFKGHPITVGEQVEFAYNQRHLANNLELMETMLKRHNKIYSFRLGLNMPQGVELNRSPKEIATKFLSVFCRKMARNKVDSEYIMKMEKEKSENPHFHIQMFVNGSKIQNHKKMVEDGERLLAAQLGLAAENNGLLDFNNQGKKAKKKNGIMIRRNSDNYKQQFDQVFKQASYVAKQTPTDQINSKERKVFYSRFRNGKSRSSK